MSYRLVSKSVTTTLNGIMVVFCVISATSVAFSAHCVKWLKIYLNFLRQKHNGLYFEILYDVVVKKFTFAISSPGEFLSSYRSNACAEHEGFTKQTASTVNLHIYAINISGMIKRSDVIVNKQLRERLRL